MREQRHAEIAGAGIAGLTAASALAKRGWSVRVHERNTELREIGAGIAVWQNGLIALELAGAKEEAIEGGERIEQWQLRDHEYRLLQQEWMLPGVAESYNVLRTKLHQALANAARRNGAEIVTGSRVAGATQDGRLELTTGERLEADLIVGADGINSPVRRSLGIKANVHDLGDGCGRHLVERRPDDVANKIVESWDGGRRVGIVPCAPDQVYIFLCCPADDEAGRAQEGGDVSTWIESFPQEAGYIERIQPGSPWLPFGDVKVSSWSRGKVALVGDAAHAMAPNLGQAACVGMMNAVTLSYALDEGDSVPAALAAWEKSERRVTDQTQRFSRFYGWIGTNWPAPMLSVRSGLIWTLANSERFQTRVNVAARYRPSFYAEEPVGQHA